MKIKIEIDGNALLLSEDESELLLGCIGYVGVHAAAGISRAEARELYSELRALIPITWMDEAHDHG